LKDQYTHILWRGIQWGIFHPCIYFERYTTWAEIRWLSLSLNWFICVRFRCKFELFK
jgi:hypothetical protein